MSRRFIRSLAPLLVVGALAAGCGGSSADATGPGVLPDPPDPPAQGSLTFSGGVQPIFTRSCAFSSCHGGPSPRQGMDLSAGRAYGNIVSVPSNQVPRLLRIQPNAPDSSYLVLKIEGKAGAVGGVGTRMPLGGQLTDAQIDTIRAWVAAGAPNN